MRVATTRFVAVYRMAKLLDRNARTAGSTLLRPRGRPDNYNWKDKGSTCLPGSTVYGKTEAIESEIKIVDVDGTVEGFSVVCERVSSE